MGFLASVFIAGATLLLATFSNGKDEDASGECSCLICRKDRERQAAQRQHPPQQPPYVSRLWKSFELGDHYTNGNLHCHRLKMSHSGKHTSLESGYKITEATVRRTRVAVCITGRFENKYSVCFTQGSHACHW